MKKYSLMKLLFIFSSDLISQQLTKIFPNILPFKALLGL